MGSGGWKRVVLGGNKEKFVQKKGFWFEKAGDFQVRLKSFRQKITFLFCGKEQDFQLMQSYPIKKSFFQHTTTPTSHRNKTNVQQPFLNIACYCELAVQ